MLDEYDNLNFKHDNREEALLERSDDQEEPLEVADQRKEHTEGSRGLKGSGVYSPLQLVKGRHGAGVCPH